MMYLFPQVIWKRTCWNFDFIFKSTIRFCMLASSKMGPRGSGTGNMKEKGNYTMYAQGENLSYKIETSVAALKSLKRYSMSVIIINKT